ncbi:hypothetical protein M8J75_003676 [Diaphorina citri]|nr:hypothetical protein M8J75_003676 [Diaphorina citri]KAI5731045.1 hypothetical protein M8J77_003791 [Diaphorina citri]
MRSSSSYSNVFLYITGVLCILLMTQAVSSSTQDDTLSPQSHGYHPDESEGRVFYSALGDILMRVPFLPLTLNVPDTLSTISGFFSYFTSEESADEPRDVMKLVRSALELTNIDELEEDLFF